MKMMPNMRNSQFQRMNDRRGGDEIEVGSITTPFFVHVKEKEMKASVGSTVILNCRVRNTNNYTVDKNFFIFGIPYKRENKR